MANQNEMTEEGLKELQEKYNYLVGTRRNEITAQIEIARGFGDLSENAEYDEARKEQAKVESEIARLQQLISTAVVKRADEISIDRVNIGTVVTVENKTKGVTKEYTIVGFEQADPWAGKISADSAIGAALNNRTVGDTVTVELPRGNQVLVIKSIRRG